MYDLALFSIRRLLAMAVIIYLIATIVFLLAHISPLDPTSTLVDPDQAGGRQAQTKLRHTFGLDRPLWEQYVSFVAGAAHGDFGLSEASGTFQQPVGTILKHRVPVTLKLGGLALLVALLVGLPVGLLSALRHNSAVDHAGQTLMMLLYAVPVFVVAPIAQLIFGAELRWLPVAGWGAPGWPGVKQMIMPVGIYGLGMAGYFSRSFRSVLLEVLAQDYIRTARSKGLGSKSIISMHACKNALVPLASIVGPAMGHLIVGAFIIELYFSIPGVGLVTATSITDGDVPMIAAAAIMLAASVVIVNALTDIFCALVDPRIRPRGGS